MSDERNDVDYQSKKLALEIKENEAKYVSGELSLDQPLQKTEELYVSAVKAAEKTTANRVLQDSSLMQLTTKIVRQCAKTYKPNTLVFQPRTFSEKLKRFYIRGIQNITTKINDKMLSDVFLQLGKESNKQMHVTPTFHYLYGTFNAAPVSPVKKKRKRYEKEKIADAIRPITVKAGEKSHDKDQMIGRATRVFSILCRNLQTEKSSICFYKFVIDPTSFVRTIEHMFTLSLLVQEGHVCIFADDQGLPRLRKVYDQEKRDRQLSSQGRMQSVMSMSIVDWKEIIEQFQLTQSLIPPPRSKKE